MSLFLIHCTEDEFTNKCFEWLENEIIEFTNKKGTCVLALSGGSTPIPIYKLLSASTKIDWSKLYIFLVDERYVPSDDKDSNTKLVNDTIVNLSKIPKENFVYPDTTLSISECVKDYASKLKELFKKAGNCDIMTLGMGNDGHIASLFPPVGKEAYSDDVVINTQTETMVIRERMSVTMNVIKESAKQAIFLKGKQKGEVYKEMIESKEQDVSRWPLLEVLKDQKLYVIAGGW